MTVIRGLQGNNIMADESEPLLGYGRPVNDGSGSDLEGQPASIPFGLGPNSSVSLMVQLSAAVPRWPRPFSAA